MQTNAPTTTAPTATRRPLASIPTMVPGDGDGEKKIRWATVSRLLVILHLCLDGRRQHFLGSLAKDVRENIADFRLWNCESFLGRLRKEPVLAYPFVGK